MNDTHAAPRRPLRSPRPPKALSLAAAAALAAGLFACSGDDDDDAEPVRIAYTVAFPSTAAAVATEEIQIGAYPDEGASTCLSLVQKRSSQQALPPPVSPPVTAAPCDLSAGVNDAPIEAGFGRVALLVVARRQGGDFLIGCTVQAVTENVEPVRVPLTLFNNTIVVPETTCTTLSARCGGGC